MSYQKLSWLLLLLIMAGIGHGYPTWIRTYYYGPVSYVVPVENGNTVFAAALGPNFNVVKIDEAGDPLWEKQFPGIPYGLVQQPSEQLMILYKVSDVLTFTALSGAGDEIWTAPAPLDTDIKGLVSTDDDCLVYLTQDSLVKVNSDGTLKWTAFIADVLEDVKVIGRSAGVYGGVALAGSYGDYYYSYGWLQTAVADSSGVILWSAEDYYLYSEYGDVIDVFGNSYGGCYAAGEFGSSFPPPMSCDATFSFLPGGDTDWKRKTNGVTCVCESDDGNAVIAGTTDLIGTDDVFIRKMNHSSGNYVWQHTHGFASTDESCICIALCEDGGFVIGGFSSPNSILIRTDSQGLVNGTGIEADLEETSIGILPVSNPVYGDHAVLEVRAPVSSALRISVHDIAGRTLFAGDINAASGIEHVDPGVLPAGVYTAVIVSRDYGTACCRVVVLD